MQAVSLANSSDLHKSSSYQSNNVKNQTLLLMQVHQFAVLDGGIPENSPSPSSWAGNAWGKQRRASAQHLHAQGIYTPRVARTPHKHSAHHKKEKQKQNGYLLHSCQITRGTDTFFTLLAK